MKKNYFLVGTVLVLLCFGACKKEIENDGSPATNRAVIQDYSDGTKGVLWPQNHTIKIAFINGTAAQKQFVKESVKIWDDLINLSFEYQDELPGSEIRIKFDPENKSGRSQIGYKENIAVKGTAPTMLLYGLLGAKKDPYKGKAFPIGTVRHEFGHMLGLSHEQLRADGTVEWTEGMNIGGTIKYVIDLAYLSKYLKSPYDKMSIMHYPVPAANTIDNTAISGYVANGGGLSQTDKDFISGVYPNN